MTKAIYRNEHQVLIKLLKAIRTNTGHCSRALGRPQSYISDVETGLRRLDRVQLRDLCEVLGYTLPQFVDEYEQALLTP